VSLATEEEVKLMHLILHVLLTGIKLSIAHIQNSCAEEGGEA
jgi:hypothetical protein